MNANQIAATLRPIAPDGKLMADEVPLIDQLAAKWAARAPVSPASSVVAAAVAVTAPAGVSAAGGDPGATYDRSAMIAELRRDEGERLKAYKDTVGKWTIGIGRNLDDVGTAPLSRSVADVRAKGISKAESDLMLMHDLDRVGADLDRRLSWWRTLDPIRQRIMVNMCFNMGIGGLCGFVNTLAMIEGRRYTEAAQNMLLSKWARQVGARAQRLSAMMRTGSA